MKKLLQLLSACALLLSSFVFAQTDCLKDLPTDVLIKKKIRTDQFDWTFSREMNEQKMTAYLVDFNNSFKKYSSGEKIPSSYVQNIDNIDAKYQVLTNELLASSSDFSTFRQNVLKKLRVSKDPSEIEALILMDYAVQIVENSGLFNRTSSLSFGCITNGIGGSSTSVMMNPSTSDIMGDSSGGIAGGGCTPQFPFPRPKNCN